MKKTLSLAIVTFLAVTSPAQITNVIKISQLPSANPITGSELLPVVQSGSTVSASVNQITAGAAAVANVASNYFALVTQTNGNNIATVSNNANAFAATALSQVQSTNAALQVQLGATNTALLNAILGTNIALIAQLNAASNQLHGALNSTNGIIQGEIASLGSGVTSGSSPTFGTVTANSVIAPFYKTYSTNAGSLSTSGQTISFDLSKWQITAYSVNAGAANTFLNFQVTNPSDGQNDTIVLTVTGQSCNLGFSSTAPGGYTIVLASNFSFPVGYTGGEGVFIPGGGGTVVLNTQVVGNVIYVSGAKF